MKKPALQRNRVWAQIGFFALFTLTPIFDLFRYDLTEKHAYFLTIPWHLGVDDLIAGRVGAGTAAVNIVLFLFLPILGTLGLIIGVAWKWGRLYCGWLCPHFSVVETINRLMLFATGKHSVWDAKKTPPWEPDGTPAPRDPRYWFVVVPAAIGFAFAWAVVGLTYLMPPFGVYHGLLTFTLSRYEVIFLTAATTVLTLEFLFARHLFCRYACAIGLFQSFAWIGNKKAMVVGFERDRLSDCANCMKGCGSAGNTVLARHERHVTDTKGTSGVAATALRAAEPAPPSGSACDAVCPMRLKPRNVKRWMFACTQCGQCVSACATVNRDNPDGPLLRWVSGDAAQRNEARFSALSQTDEDAGARR
jgi:polyferredoxin